MVLRLHDITTSLKSLEFPALVKPSFRLTVYGISNPDAEDLVNFLKNSELQGWCVRGYRRYAGTS